MLNLAQPPTQTLVAPSVLSSDFGDMARDCQTTLDAGADCLHVDVMDGHFAPNLTLGLDAIKGLRKHCPDTLLDTHLMVEHPQHYIKPFANAGNNHFSFHLEVCSPFRNGGPDVERLVQDITNAGMTAGLVLNPDSPADWALRYLDALGDALRMVLVMSVYPGKSGQSFLPTVLPKTRQLADALPPTCRLEMDGGLSPTTCAQAANAGVDTMVSGSAIFNAPNRAQVIQALKQHPPAR